MKKKSLLSVTFSLFCIFCFAGNSFQVSKDEQKKIRDEAENWIDDMPEGIQDRLSDAVNHAIHGFFNEINYFRNFSDTIGFKKYSVKIKDIKGGKLGDVSMRLYSGQESSSDSPVLIYFHGGGWSMGSIETTDRFCMALASQGNVKVISVDYPLAPENPYPAALKVGIEAVEYISANSEELGLDKKRISLGGDGAGGNIAFQTFQNLQDDIEIRSLVLFYPLLKTTGSLNAENKREFGRGFGFDSRLWEVLVEGYNGKEMEASKKIPPTLMISAGRDIIIDEETNFASSNSAITYVLFEGALHGFITDGHQNTALNKAVELTDFFLND